MPAFSRIESTLEAILPIASCACLVVGDVLLKDTLRRTMSGSTDTVPTPETVTVLLFLLAPFCPQPDKTATVAARQNIIKCLVFIIYDLNKSYVVYIP